MSDAQDTRTQRALRPSIRSRSLIDEEAAEEAGAELEAFDDARASAGHVRVLLPPRPEIVFRPEEVERRSERIGHTGRALGPLADPDHQAGRARAGTARVHLELERGTGMVAA
jgi:hypothetical protein